MQEKNIQCYMSYHEKHAYIGERPSRPGISIGCGGVKNDLPTAVYL